MAGMIVYGICIFVANFQLAINFNVHTWHGIVMLWLGVIAYFLFYGLAALVFKGEINHLFEPTWAMPMTYVVTFFCVIQVFIFEKAYNNFSKIMKDKREEKEQFE